MAGNIAPNPTTDNLIFYLDSANNKSYISGSTSWNDLLGNVLSPTLVGTPGYSSDNGGSIVFDGVDDYVNVLPNGSGSIFETQTFSIEFWYKPNYSGSYEVLWSYDYTVHNPPYYAQHVRIDTSITAFPNRITFGFNEGGAFSGLVSSNNVITDGVWNHIIVTKSPTQASIYVNGRLVGNNSTLTSGIIYYNQPVWIGKSNFEPSVKGNIAITKFYNKVLSSQEVLQNFNTLRVRFGI